MGVIGLLSLVRKKLKNGLPNKPVDLAEIAARHDYVEILVDGLNFERWVLEKFNEQLHADKKHPNLLSLCGGEYPSLDLFLTRMIKKLQALKIKLVFYIDRAKGAFIIIYSITGTINNWYSYCTDKEGSMPMYILYKVDQNEEFFFQTNKYYNNQ